MDTPAPGVKQGGVLSPLLFTVYLDQLIIALKEFRIGCHINGMFAGAFLYADNFAALHNFLFNVSKTKCMYFNDASSQLQNTAKFLGRPIEYEDSIDLLDVAVTSRIRERNVNNSV